jgi:hypothetical protein
MGFGPGRRAAAAASVLLRRCRPGVVRGVAFTWLIGLAAAGCATDVRLTGTFAPPVASAGPTVAFESIDGPPPGVFQKLVQNIEAEAGARQLAVVSREAPAQYRVRSYLSAQIERKQVTITWVWDVYDADKRRAVRIAGEEKAGPAGRDAWLAADERALRAIARTGVTELAKFFANPGRDQPGPGPADGPLTVAAMGGPAEPVPNR